MERIVVAIMLLIFFLRCQSENNIPSKMESSIQPKFSLEYQSNFDYNYSPVFDTTLIFSTTRNDWTNRVEIYQFPKQSNRSLFSLCTVTLNKNKIDSTVIETAMFFTKGFTLYNYNNPQIKFTKNGTIIISDSLTCSMHYTQQIILENNEKVNALCSRDTTIFNSVTYKINELGKITKND